MKTNKNTTYDIIDCNEQKYGTNKCLFEKTVNISIKYHAPAIYKKQC